MFNDFPPHAPIYLLIVPRRHIRSISDIPGRDAQLVAGILLAAQRMAGHAGV